MPKRINNPHSCVVCGRRPEGLAVGKPTRLGWYCDDCGAALAKEVLQMPYRDFDVFEERAIKAVAEQAPQEPTTIEPAEWPDFIRWAVKKFSDAIRTELESGKPPF